MSARIEPRVKTERYRAKSYTLTQLRSIHRFIFNRLPNGARGRKGSPDHLPHKDNPEVLARRIMKQLQDLYIKDNPEPREGEDNIYSLTLEELTRLKRTNINGERLFFWPILAQHSYKKAVRTILKRDNNEEVQWYNVFKKHLKELNNKYDKDITVLDVLKEEDAVKDFLEQKFYIDTLPLKKRKLSPESANNNSAFTKVI